MTTIGAAGRLLKDRRRRTQFYVCIAIVLSVLCIFPQPYIGRARLLPRDPSNALGAAFGSSGDRIQDLGVLFGGGAHVIDLYLAIGQSDDIRNEVIDKLHLVGPSARFATREQAGRSIDNEVAVESLPGGLLQIEAKTHDRDLSLALTRAFSEAISQHLRSINNEQVTVKEKLLQDRIQEASARLSRTQVALNEFRRVNRISAAPEEELGSAIAVKSGLDARLQAKLVEIKILQQMLGPDNPKLRVAQTEVEGLQNQIAQSTKPAGASAGVNAGGLTVLSTQYLDHYRDYLFAQQVYGVYARLAEQVAVEDLSDRSALTSQFVESPHVTPGWNFNVWAVASLTLLGLVIVFVEFYAPATGIVLWSKGNADAGQ